MDSSSSSSSKPRCSCIRPVPPVKYDWPDVDDKYNRIMNEEELAAYFREVNASEGFDVKTIPCSALCGGIAPLRKSKLSCEGITKGAEEAIKDYNVKNGTSFEVVEIENATIQGSCGLRYYITFKVKPSDSPVDNPTTTFQAKVLYRAKPTLTIELCRIKPGMAFNYP